MTTPEELSGEIRRLIEAQRYRAAAEACDRLNLEFPEFDYGWYMTSRVALIIHKPLPGLQAIDRALAIAPEKPEWLFQKLRCLSFAGYVLEAKEMAAGLAALQFKTAETSSELAMLLSRLGMDQAAIAHYRRAVELGSESPDLYLNLAAGERKLGNIDAALDALDKSLELQPDDAGALYLRSTLRRQTPTNNHTRELKAAIERLADRPDDVMRLCYALTKEFEDIEDYDRAFEQLDRGSEIQRNRLNFSLQQELDTLRTVREQFVAEKFDGSVPGHVNADPIFIVGMPRTGTALVDQILRSHPVVQSVGSSQAFTEALTNECLHGYDGPPGSIPELVTRAVQADFERVGENYVRSARPKASDLAHFVDCRPMNFLYAGMIHLALPKARIVVLERDPMDTCFYAYRTLFEGAYPFSYHLDDIAEFYLGYQKQMGHWESVIPGVMHTISYERLVTDPKPVIEDLLEYCGLSFDAACLGFWEDEQVVVRGVPQPSRQEAYQSSIGMWKHYDKQLAAVREKIGA
ncbi:MAG: sulfotransferase [Pseudomonadota bacterium]